ncbi:MAG: sugar transferase [Limisphaerales bacterium]|jgi:undecaprenyl phosphate N,N'-diacetylbacillosamine 1-phosphate transferase
MIDNLIKIEADYNSTKYKKNYKNFYTKVLKRLLDIIFCFLISPLLFLIIISAAVAIKIEDRGPIFYRSSRIGKNFKEFGMLKLRSMKVRAPDLRNADGSTYNSKKDPRVTRIGHFLRETSIDELPQIINVLVGQMSIVGPRAGDIESKDTYKEDEKDKVLIKPGITGYTQAYYRNSISVREKRLYDAWYAHNISFLLDIKILFKTFFAVFKRDNLYTNKDVYSNKI